MKPISLLLLAATLLTGCQASLRPLKTTEPSAAIIKGITPLAKKIPLAVSLQVEAPDSIPTWGGKFTYPVKSYFERAFQDAGAAAFSSVVPAGEYAYTLQVQALSSQLRDSSAFGSSKKKASFQSEINTILRDPDGKVLQNKNFSGTADSVSDGTSVPEAVWMLSYQMAGEFVSAVKSAPWLRGALAPAPKVAGGSNPAEMQAMMDAAARRALDAKKSTEPEKPQFNSDVDKPKYQTPENPNLFALVVGIEKYSTIPEAPYAERDAVAVRDHLLAMGYPQRNIILLTGDKATKTGLTKNLETWLPRNTTEDSSVFFYYSGHGAPDVKNGQAYLVPWDGDPQFLEDTAYPIKRLYEKLGSLKAKRVVMAMDSCFSGAGGRSVLAKGARPLVNKIEKIESIDDKIVSFSAAAGDQISGTLDDQGHGAFTYFLLKGLSGEAGDHSGKVTVKSLYDYLSPKVADAARRQNRDQLPQLTQAPSEDGSLRLR